MRIKSVTYRRNVELHAFVHAHAECTVEVDEGDDVKEAWNVARAFVKNKLIEEAKRASGTLGDG